MTYNDEYLDERLQKILKAVPTNTTRGIFNLSDVSINTLYSPSETNSAINELIRETFIEPVETNSRNIDIDSTYRLTDKGSRFKRDQSLQRFG